MTAPIDDAREGSDSDPDGFLVDGARATGRRWGVGRLADLHRPRCRVCHWPCSDGGCQPDLCSDVTRPAFPRRADDAASRERWRLVWRAVRRGWGWGEIAIDDVRVLRDAGALDLLLWAWEQAPDPLATRREGAVVDAHRCRCQTCGVLQWPRWGERTHKEDCDAMPF